MPCLWGAAHHNGKGDGMNGEPIRLMATFEELEYALRMNKAEAKLIRRLMRLQRPDVFTRKPRNEASAGADGGADWSDEVDAGGGEPAAATDEEPQECGYLAGGAGANGGPAGARPPGADGGEGAPVKPGASYPELDAHDGATAPPEGEPVDKRHGTPVYRPVADPRPANARTVPRMNVKAKPKPPPELPM